MDIRRITDRFFVSPQILPEDLPGIADAGIAMILCNRPENEVPPSLQAASIETAAREAGVAFAACALTHQTMTPDVIRANRDMIETAGGTVLAYCASGTRSTIAWALGMAGDMPTDEIISAARHAGYDLEGLRPNIEAFAGLPRSG